MIRNAAWVQRNGPVRLVSTTACHCASVRFSIGTGGAPVPALLNSTSRRPNFSTVRAKSVSTDRASATLVGTAQHGPVGCERGGLCESVRAAARERDGVAFSGKR